MDSCSALSWTSFGDAGACGRRIWITILGSVSRAVFNPGSAMVFDYVLTVLLVGGIFYTVLFATGAIRPQE